MLPLGSLCVHEEYLRRRIAKAASPTMRSRRWWASGP